MTMQESWVREQEACLSMIGEAKILITPRVFSSGNVGYYFSGKMWIGEEHCQVTMSAVVIGSKDWKDTPPEETPEQLFKDPETPQKGPQEPAKPKKGTRPHPKAS